MFVKLAVLACAVAASTAAWNGPQAGGLPAAQFPAGISPEACPNFPNCDNPAVALTASGPAPSQIGYVAPSNYATANQQWNNDGQYSGEQYNGQYNNGQYNQQQYNQQYNSGYSQQAYNPTPAPVYNSAPAYNPQTYNSAPAYNPAPAYNTAPAYNPQAYNAPAHNGAPAQAAQVPAGVDPSSCPNYPFCK